MVSRLDLSRWENLVQNNEADRLGPSGFVEIKY